MTTDQSGSETPYTEIPEQRVREALKGRDHICFGHDWGGDPLSKTHIMRAIAREGRVLWIDSIGYRAPTASVRDLRRAVSKLKSFAAPVREVEPNLWVLSPLTIPLYDLRALQRLNRTLLAIQIRRALDRLAFRRVVNWVFTPTAAVVAGSLGEEKIIYYCVDDFTAFSDAGTPALVELEKQLLRQADLVVVSAQGLLESKSAYNPNTVLVRHGVDYDTFHTALDPSTELPEDVARLPRPIIGYFGFMAADWIDLELLEKIARRYPHGSLVMLGRTQMDMSRLARHPNVRLLGPRRFEDLPAYCKAFDVAINPFPINAATLRSNPLKVREYLAAGLPVVSTRIPEVEVLGDLVLVAQDHDDFLTKLETALQNPGDKAVRSSAMKEQTWAARYLELKRHLVRHGVV